MRKYLSLTRVLIKNNLGMMTNGKTKWSIVLYAVLAICLLPMAILLYYMFSTALETLEMLNQTGSVLALGFHISSLVTFIFSIFLIPSVFYFSADNETLLSLPLKPQTILSGKLTVCLVYEYVFTLMIQVPMFIAYLQHADITPLYYIFALIIFLTIPIYPLILSSIIAMLVMRFVPFFKNRDRFNMLAGIVSVIFAFAFSFFFNSRSMSENPANLILMLTSGDNSLISLFSALFPGVPFASRALISSDIVQLLVYIGITAIAILVFLTAGKALYLQGVVGFSETSTSKKKLSDEDLTKQNQKRNVTRTYMIKELKLLVRTPVYFLNCIGMCFLMPIMLFVIYFTGDLSALAASLPQSIKDTLTEFLPYAVLVGLAIGFFLSNMNLISSTAISREGQNISFMKYIPMSISKQIHAKLLSGIVMTILSLLITLVCVYILFPILPISFYILGGVAAILSIIIGNYVGILIDILHPKLVWEQEAVAVKQNISGMIAMFLGMALAALMGFLIYITPYSMIVPACVGICIVFLVLIIVLYKCIGKIAMKRLENY